MSANRLFTPAGYSAFVPHVFLTVDTEIAWRHHAAGLPVDELCRRSFEPGGVGLSWQLALLARHRLKACFFVDPLPALAYGLAPFRAVVAMILDAGQEVQLHLHPQWAGARADDRRAHGRFQLWEHDATEQAQLIAGAAELLVAAGGPPPVAFRAGSYAADDATLGALAGLGFRYDSSHCGAEAPAWSRLSLPAHRIAPVRAVSSSPVRPEEPLSEVEAASRRTRWLETGLRQAQPLLTTNGVAHVDLIEVPVTVIEDRLDHYRTFQPCALSAGEAAAALDHAVADDHAAVTIVSHSFELANRAGTRANAVHVRRFEALCALLDARRDVLPTTWFGDAPALPLDRDDRPLPPDRLRTGWRQAEQLWSNWIEERAA